jgi:hypothetical protein
MHEKIEGLHMFIYHKNNTSRMYGINILTIWKYINIIYLKELILC